MQKPLFKRSETPNFSLPITQHSFVEQIQDEKELYLKELMVNQAEQNLLAKRISLMKEFVNDLPASDPQYSMLLIQVQMDQIEWDELRLREQRIIQKISDE